MEFGLRHAHDMHTKVFVQLDNSSRISSRAGRKLDSVIEFGRELVYDLLASWTALHMRIHIVYWFCCSCVSVMPSTKSNQIKSNLFAINKVHNIRAANFCGRYFVQEFSEQDEIWQFDRGIIAIECHPYL